MSRTDVFGETASIPNFSAISTPRRIRLVANDPTDPGNRLGRPWDFISVQHRADTIVYVGVNGATAASTASTSLVPAFVNTPTITKVFGVFKTAPFDFYTKATSLSVQATGGSTVSVGIFLGRF